MSDFEIPVAPPRLGPTTPDAASILVPLTVMRRTDLTMEQVGCYVELLGLAKGRPTLALPTWMMEAWANRPSRRLARLFTLLDDLQRARLIRIEERAPEDRVIHFLPVEAPSPGGDGGGQTD